MNRWKKESRATLVLMHAHNIWSIWWRMKLSVAGELGLPISYVKYPNCSGDGSWDTEYYTCAAALDRLGGLHALENATQARLEEMSTPQDVVAKMAMHVRVGDQLAERDGAVLTVASVDCGSHSVVIKFEPYGCTREITAKLRPTKKVRVMGWQRD